MSQLNAHTGPPESVRTSVRLFLVTILIGIAQAGVPGNPNAAMFKLLSGSILVLMAAIYGLFAFVLWSIYWGKNWARMITTILTVLATPFEILTIPQSLSESALIGIVEIVNTILVIIAVACLFSVESTAWFRRQQSD